MTLDNFGSSWITLGYFWPFFNSCTGPQINEQKLRYDLNHQMSAYMVQEDHQRRLNTLLFQYVISLYFSWIIFNHPVESPYLVFTLAALGVRTKTHLKKDNSEWCSKPLK